MARRTLDHQQTFSIEDGWLVRMVVQPDGSSYQHRCSLAHYQAVAHDIDEHAINEVTTNDLLESLPEVPCTQAAIALAFLKERGCVAIRRCYPASNVLIEDVLLEFHALDS